MPSDEPTKKLHDEPGYHAKRLVSFLKKHEKEVGSKDFTHVAAQIFHGTTGTYKIENDDVNKLLDLVSKATKENYAQFAIGEKPGEVGPILIDIDLHYDPPDEVLVNPKKVSKLPHAYKQEIFEEVAKVYRRVIDLCFNTAQIPTENYGIWFFEKAHPTVDKNVIHDGFHGLIEVSCPHDVQYFIRNAVLEDIEKILIAQGLRPKIKQSIEEIVDKRIIKNAWMIYGCAKKTSLPYLLTKGFKFERDGKTIRELTPKKIEDLKTDNLSDRFSIQNKKQTVDLRNEDIRQDIKKYFDEKISTKNRIIVTSKNEHKKGGTSLETVQHLTKILSCERANGRESWLNVGLCLKKLDDNLLEDWIEFSKKSPKYQDGECENLWSSFRDDWLQYSMGSLYYWAKLDNEKLFYEIINETVQGLVMKCIKNGSMQHHDVSVILYHYYKDRYVCVDQTAKAWMEFRGHTWKRINIGYTLMNKIPAELGDVCEKMGHDFLEKIRRCTDDADVKKYKSYNEEVIKFIKNLKNDSFQKSVMSQCANMFHKEYDDFDKNLNANPFLIACKNGIIDLKAKDELSCFRAGTPDDLCSLTTGNDYIPYNAQSKQIKGLKRFIREVLPRRKVRHHFMKVLSSLLFGRNEEEKIYILTGSGGNGKSKLMEIVVLALGEYAKSFNIALLTQKRANASGPNPALHKLKCIRAAIAAEPDKEQELNTGFTKEMSGGDKISSRTHQKEEEEWMPMFKILLMCNDLPPLDSIDDGVMRRIEVIEFIVKFCANPDPNDPYQLPRDNKLGRKIKEWGPAFLSYMVHYYFTYYVREVMEPPNAVIKTTLDYQKANDKIKEFMEIKLKPVKKSEVDIKDIASRFRRWYIDEMGTGGAGKILNKKEIEAYLKRRYRKEFTGTKLKNFEFVEDESDDEDREPKTDNEVEVSAYVYDSDGEPGVQEDYLSEDGIRPHCKPKPIDDDDDSEVETTYRDMIERHMRKKERQEDEIEKRVERAKKRIGNKINKVASSEISKANDDELLTEISSIKKRSGSLKSVRSERSDMEHDETELAFGEDIDEYTYKNSTKNSRNKSDSEHYKDSDASRKTHTTVPGSDDEESIKSKKSKKSAKSLKSEITEVTVTAKSSKSSVSSINDKFTYNIKKPKGIELEESGSEERPKNKHEKNKKVHNDDFSTDSEIDNIQSSDGEGLAFELAKLYKKTRALPDRR